MRKYANFFVVSPPHPTFTVAMPIPPDLYERISHLVAENRVNSAVELLEKQLPALRQNSPEQYHAALVLMQDFNDIQERKIKGLLVVESESNSFSFRLLEFSRKLGRKFVPPPPSPPPIASPDPLRVAQPAYTAPPPERVTRPVNRTGPVNAKPGKAYRQSSNNGGSTFGKLVLYGLAALGLLMFTIILVALVSDYEEDDLENYPSDIYSPADINPGIIPAPATIQNASMSTLSGTLGNSNWYGDVMGNLSFNADGSVGTYHNGASALTIAGVENGMYYGVYSEPASSNSGMFAITFDEGKQKLTINSLNDDGNITGQLFLIRQ